MTDQRYNLMKFQQVHDQKVRDAKKSPRDRRCHLCGDPAPVGLYECEWCHDRNPNSRSRRDR